MALWRRDRSGHPAGPGLLHHSDAGSQYTSFRYTAHLLEAGIDASIGTVGDVYDNALIKSAIGLYKTELMKKRAPWKSLPEVELATTEYIDWFNARRLHGCTAPSDASRPPNTKPPTTLKKPRCPTHPGRRLKPRSDPRFTDPDGQVRVRPTVDAAYGGSKLKPELLSASGSRRDTRVLATGGAKSRMPLNCEPTSSRVRGVPPVRRALVDSDPATRLPRRGCEAGAPVQRPGCAAETEPDAGIDTRPDRHPRPDRPPGPSTHRRRSPDHGLPGSGQAGRRGTAQAFPRTRTSCGACWSRQPRAVLPSDGGSTPSGRKPSRLAWPNFRPATPKCSRARCQLGGAGR